MTISKKNGTTGSLGKKQLEDKFYTKPEVVDLTLSFLSSHVNMNDFDVIIEPSAGSGAYSKPLMGVYDNVMAFDLKPEDTSGLIKQADWLVQDKTIFDAYKNKLVIGNPPFGSSGSLALDFIRSSGFADVVAFILPKGFKKVSVQNRVPLNFFLKGELLLPENSFTLNGTDYSVPCVFQIWEKSSNLRTIETRTLVSSILQFTTKDEADFRIQRVGGNAGVASLNKDYSAASNYFVKNISDLPHQALIDLINGVSFPTIDHTTGPRSLPKSELIQVVEHAVNSLI